MRSLFAAMLAGLLGGPAYAEVPGLGVKDDAKLFSPKAVDHANKLIADVQEKYGIDLYVETMTKLPEADASQLLSMRSRDRMNFLHQTALKRAEAAGVNGIYLMVTTQPSNTVIVGWPEDREREKLPLEIGGGLSLWKREHELRRPFAKTLAVDRDGALISLVEHFRMAVRSRESPPPSPLETIPATVLVAGMLGAWVVLSLLRGAAARGESSVMNEPAGTLYQPAMLGSMFGVPAGFWIYDRLFRAERPAAPVVPVVPVNPVVPVVVEEAPLPHELPATHFAEEPPAHVENLDEPVN